MIFCIFGHTVLFGIFTAQCYAQHGIATAKSSVRPSVYPRRSSIVIT